MYSMHGYTGALWCAFYTGGWPMGWTDGDWYSDFLCPEVSGRRWAAAATSWAAARRRAGDRSGRTRGADPRHVVRACQRLKERFGPRHTICRRAHPEPAHSTERYKGMAQAWEAALGGKGYWDRWPGWDMHGFGVWYAEMLWPQQPDDAKLAATIKTIMTHRLTNGEVLYGFVWASLALLRSQASPLDPSA